MLHRGYPPVATWELDINDVHVDSRGRLYKAGKTHIGCTDPLLTHFPTAQQAHLCSSNRPDHWDNYAINTGNEKKVGHATFHRPDIPTY